MDKEQALVQSAQSVTMNKKLMKVVTLRMCRRVLHIHSGYLKVELLIFDFCHRAAVVEVKADETETGQTKALL